MLILLVTMILKTHKVVTQKYLDMDTLSCKRDAQLLGNHNFKLKSFYSQQNQNTHVFHTLYEKSSP